MIIKEIRPSFDWQSRGHRFDSDRLHFNLQEQVLIELEILDCQINQILFKLVIGWQ